MRRPDTDPGIAVAGSGDTWPGGQYPPGSGATGQAAQGPIPEPVSAAGTLAPGTRPGPGRQTDSPAEAQGRRILSTAFVRVGPDGHLTVERRDGQMLVLRDVVMRAGDYCGVRVSASSAKARYCGGYAEVVAAQPGGRAVLEETAPVASNPVGPGRSPPQPR